MSTRAKALLIIGGLLLLAWIVIPAAVGSSSPREWLDDHYEHVSGDDEDEETVVFRSEDSVDTTVNAIIAGTDPDDTAQGTSTTSSPGTSTPGATSAEDDAVFLRYSSDYLVAVTPDGDGSRIELDEFDRGYNGHGGVAFLGVWSNHYGRGGGGSFFRGGGSGFGK